MKTQYFAFFIGLLTVLCLPACTSDINQDDLIGRWEIKSAERDSKPTESLFDTFFEFRDAGKMSTNFNAEGSAKEADFVLTGNLIEQKGDPSNSYTIDHLEGNEMILRTTLLNYNFKLVLQKQ